MVFNTYFLHVRVTFLVSKTNKFSQSTTVSLKLYELKSRIYFIPSKFLLLFLVYQSYHVKLNSNWCGSPELLYLTRLCLPGNDMIQKLRLGHVTLDF